MAHLQSPFITGVLSSMCDVNSPYVIKRIAFAGGSSDRQDYAYAMVIYETYISGTLRTLVFAQPCTGRIVQEYSGRLDRVIITHLRAIYDDIANDIGKGCYNQIPFVVTNDDLHACADEKARQPAPFNGLQNRGPNNYVVEHPPF